MADNNTPDPIAEATARINSPEYKQRIADHFGVEYQGVKPTPPPADAPRPPLMGNTMYQGNEPGIKVETVEPGGSRASEVEAALRDIEGAPIDPDLALKIQKGEVVPTTRQVAQIDAQAARWITEGKIQVSQEQVLAAKEMLEDFKADPDRRALLDRGDRVTLAWFKVINAVIAAGALKGW